MFRAGQFTSERDNWLLASQAKNASSILVARSNSFGLNPFECKRLSVTDSVHKVPPLSSVTCPYMPAVCPKLLYTASCGSDVALVNDVI